MKNVTTELKVGIFAIVVIVIISYMTFKVGGMPLIWEKGYKLYAEFDDVSGLDEQSRIKVAGVEAGRLEKIKLKDGKAKLTLLIEPRCLPPTLLCLQIG
ncbi:MAG: MCE family protein [Nitrospirae bacterium]|nr:MCE family protein [Nitrospirota bacterium]